MMTGGRRAALALLCCATLLLILSSAVSGMRDLGRFAERLGREQALKVIRVEGDHDEQDQWRANPVEEVPLVKIPVVEEEKQPAAEEGFLEKARSFLSGVSMSIGNGIPSPAEFLFPKREQERDRVEEAALEKVIFGRPMEREENHHRRSAHSQWSEIYDLIRDHPERVSADGISATEPLSLDDDVTEGAALLQQNFVDMVSSVVESYRATDVQGNALRICVDTLDDHLRTIVKMLKVGVRTFCHGGLASPEEQRFCNFFNDHSIPALMTIFARAAVNPVEIAWEKLSQSAVCFSVDPSSEFLDNLKLMQGVASELVMPDDVPMEHDQEHHHMFHKHRHEHGDHERHWWQRIFHKDREMKHHAFDGRAKHFWHHGPKEEGERGLHGHDHHERHWWQRMMDGHRDMKPDHHEDEHDEQHGPEGKLGPHDLEAEEEHEKHRWGRLFGDMFHKHRHTRHHGFGHVHDKDCLYRSVQHLEKGVRWQIHTTCEMTKDPNVMNACKFADKHKFLVMAWLAAELPVWRKAADSCAQRHDASMGSFENEVRHAPDLEIVHVEPVDIDLTAEDAYREFLRRHAFPRELQWSSRACTKRHVNRVRMKALHLRGHVMGISSSDNGDLEERIRPIVLGHFVQDDSENAQSLEHGSPEEGFSYFHIQLGELARAEVESIKQVQADSATETEKMMSHNRGLDRQWGGYHLRISARPQQRGMNLSEGHHFRISANPHQRGRPMSDGPRYRISANPEVAGELKAVPEAELHNVTPNHPTENRAVM